jgi:hypothetical protein
MIFLLGLNCAVGVIHDALCLVPNLSRTICSAVNLLCSLIQNINGGF